MAGICIAILVYPTLLRNEVGNGENWLGVKLIGNKSNRGGIGAHLRLRAGDKTQIREIISGSSFLSSEDPRAHFGLDRAGTVDVLDVRMCAGQAVRSRC